MRSAVALILAISFVTFSEALATPNYVVSVDKLDDLRHGGGSTTTGANVRGYAQPNDGGGGHFVIKSGSCADDDGVEILDTAGNCWHRQFSGPVDIRWYGLNASTHDIITQFGRAFSASESSTGNRTVITGELAIALTGTGDLNIPTGDTLDCQGTIGGVSNPHWSVPTLPSSIVLPPNSRIAAGSRSTIENCNVRPSWFTSAVQSTLTSTRNVIDNLLHNFAGTGVFCQDDGCSIQNVAVYGFDVGIEAIKSSRFYMNNVVVDSNVGIWWDAMAGASKNINPLADKEHQPAG
jgi:hypothetical protein